MTRVKHNRYRTVAVSEQMLKQMLAKADEKGWSMSRLIRSSLRQFLKKEALVDKK